MERPTVNAAAERPILAVKIPAGGPNKGRTKGSSVPLRRYAIAPCSGAAGRPNRATTALRPLSGP